MSNLEKAAKKYSGIMYDREDYEEKYFNGQGCDKYDAFLEGAKWQAKRMYSEEDLIEAFKGGSKMSWTDVSQETQEPYYYDFNEWVKQFKKQ